MYTSLQNQKDLYALLICCVVEDMQAQGQLTDDLYQAIDPLAESHDYAAIYHLPAVKHFVATQAKVYPNYPHYLVKKYA